MRNAADGYDSGCTINDVCFFGEFDTVFAGDADDVGGWSEFFDLLFGHFFAFVEVAGEV